MGASGADSSYGKIKKPSAMLERFELSATLCSRSTQIFICLVSDLPREPLTTNVISPMCVLSSRKELAIEERAVLTGSLNFSLQGLLSRISRHEPDYIKLLAHPLRHEMPVDGPLAHQNIRDRYYGQNDPVAQKMLGR